jgi:hypothetical protein
MHIIFGAILFIFFICFSITGLKKERRERLVIELVKNKKVNLTSKEQKIIKWVFNYRKKNPSKFDAETDTMVLKKPKIYLSHVKGLLCMPIPELDEVNKFLEDSLNDIFYRYQYDGKVAIFKILDWWDTPRGRAYIYKFGCGSFTDFKEQLLTINEF